MFNTAHFHPMLVHFPIALISFGFLFEIFFLLRKQEICLTKAGFYLIIAGAITGALAALAGGLFTAEMEGEAGKIREIHETLAFLTIALAFITAAFRIYLAVKKEEKPGLKMAAFALYALTTVSVMATGFFGGTLVYNFMMPL